MIGPQGHTPRYSNEDKNLIAEQPGRFVLFVGVLLAVTLGLIVRGLLSPNKIRGPIQAAASSINKDLKVQFDTASVSLSRGLLPRFAVIITNVKMESENSCWMTPLLTADEIRLPVSFWALVFGGNPVTEVGAGKVRIQLRTGFKSCENAPATTTAAQPESSQLTQFVTLKNKKSQRSSSASASQVEAVRIDELTIVTPSLSAPLELSSFAIRMKSNAPKVIEMTAKTHLMRDEIVGDYLSHATIWSEYTEFPKTHVSGRITGNWREGSYQVKANYFPKEEELSAGVDLKHVPLSQVSHVLKKFSLLSTDLNTRQVWVSVNAQMTSKTSDFKKSQVQVRDLRLEGDLGDVRVPEAQVKTLEPLTYAPFRVEIDGLNIEKLLALSNRPHPANTLGHLGSFTGKAEIASENDIEISGVHRGLEFIFSNKGQRELQTLKEFDTKLKLENNRWNLIAGRAVVDQGLLDGSLHLTADKQWRDLDIEGKAERIRLAPNIIRLMTGGGQVGPLSGDLRLALRGGTITSLKGTMNAEDLLIEGVQISKSRMQFDSVRDEILAQAQAQRVSVNATSPTFQVLKGMIEPEWMNDGRLEIKNLTSQLQFHDFKRLTWKNMTAQLDKGGRVNSDGNWDEDGLLTGSVQTGTGKSPRRWVIGGRRDGPVFTLADTAKKKKP